MRVVKRPREGAERDLIQDRAVDPSWELARTTGPRGECHDPIIESPDALVIDATTHNGIAHLAEFVQRDRDQMLVGIAVA